MRIPNRKEVISNGNEIQGTAHHPVRKRRYRSLPGERTGERTLGAENRVRKARITEPAQPTVPCTETFDKERNNENSFFG